MALAATVDPTQDVQAQPEFTKQDLALVWKVCHHVHRSYGGGRHDPHDMLGSAWCGWREAKLRFDPERGVSFAVFAYPLIRGRVLDELRGLMPFTRTVRAMLGQYHDKIASCAESLDEAACSTRQGHRPASQILFDSALLDHDPFRHAEFDFDQAEVVDETTPEKIYREQVLKMIGDYIDRLPRDMGQALRMVFLENMQMEEAGKRLGVSESRVSQLCHNGVGRVIGHMKEKCREIPYSSMR